MAKKNENTGVQAVCFCVATAIAGMILWPILDIIWCKAFTHSEFVYTVKEYVVQPAIFAVIITLVFFGIQIVSSKKKK